VAETVGVLVIALGHPWPILGHSMDALDFEAMVNR
jgi:hypothetical protein